MRIQSIQNQQTQSRPSFGALKIKATDFIPFQYNEQFGLLLEKHGLQNSLFAGMDGMNFVTIIMSRKGSRVEKAIKQLIGEAAESIGIKDARKYIQNHTDATADVDIGSSLSI